MLRNAIRGVLLTVVASGAIMLTTGQANALTPEACEDFGGTVRILIATITQQPLHGRLDKFGAGRCVCDHRGDGGIDQQPVYGLAWLNDQPGNPYEAGFYQCIM